MVLGEGYKTSKGELVNAKEKEYARDYVSYKAFDMGLKEHVLGGEPEEVCHD